MMPELSVSLGRLRLPNPVLVASGTFGYAKEMEGVTDLARLGGIVPKTVTMAPRAGNPPPRTVETASGMLNAIGLDNDGLDHFLDHHLPYLRTVGCPIILNIAAKAEDEFPVMARKARGLAGLDPGFVDRIELARVLHADRPRSAARRARAADPGFSLLEIGQHVRERPA